MHTWYALCANAAKGVARFSRAATTLIATVDLVEGREADSSHTTGMLAEVSPRLALPPTKFQPTNQPTYR